MLRHYRRSIKLFWRKTIICVTALVLFIDAGTLAQVMAQQQYEQEHLRIIEEHARIVRTYIDPMLPVGQRQAIVCRKLLKSSKQALGRVKADKDAKSLIKDVAVLQKRLKTIHYDLQAELMERRNKLLENDIPQEILDRHDEFCEAAENRYRQFDRLLTIVQRNQGNRSQLRTNMEELVEFLRPKSKVRPMRNSSEPSRPYLPRHGTAFSAGYPGSPPFFQWPWQVAAMNDEFCYLAQRDVVTGPPDGNDLARDIPEINFDPNDSNDPIMAKAEQLAYSPVKIFEYVRNELTYEPYYGSVKGAKRTLEEGGGNDMDLASTLMALLRASDIPCRYALGIIELSAEDAARWTGISDSEQIVELFRANNICYEVLDYAGEEPQTIRIDHVWVKAYVDNFPYRGAFRGESYEGNSDGDAWLDLDPSFKQHTFTSSHGIEDSVGVALDPDTLLTNAKGEATVNDVEGYVFGIDDELIEEQLLFLAEPIRDYLAAGNLTAETAFRQRQVSEERYGILPITDQYKLHKRVADFSVLPDELRHELTFTLRNPDNTKAFSVTMSLPELAGKKVTLLYEPASTAYADLLDPNLVEDPNSFPVYDKLLRPQLAVDGQLVASADRAEEMVGMGRWQDLEMTFKTPDGDDVIVHPVRAGGVHSLVLDPQRITGGHLDQHYADMNGVLQIFDANGPLTPDQTIGDVLHGIGLSYFHQIDRFNQITAGSLDVAITRQPSVVNVAWDLRVTELYNDSNLPFEAASDRVRITVIRDVHTPVAIETQESDTFIPENQFLFTSALTASALEHNVLMQAFPGKGAGSVARVIRKANDPNNDPNVPIYTITTLEDANTLTENGGPLENLPDYVKEDIKHAANADCEITIPKNPVQIANITDCNYIGYILRDIKTSASDFVLYDVGLIQTIGNIGSGERIGAELINNSLTPVQLLRTCDPNSDPNHYNALRDIVDSTAFWLKVTEGATTNAGLSYLPAIIDINRWFETRTELDPVTTVASVLAVTSPITRLSEQSAILNVEAGAGSDGEIVQPRSNWVRNDANEFIIHADVTRDVQWQATIYRYGEPNAHFDPCEGSAPDLVAAFKFEEPNDGYYRYVLTAGSDANAAVPVKGTFHVDLTEPNAIITDANVPDLNVPGVLVVKGTAWDDYFTNYEVSITQYGNEPNTVFYGSTQPVKDGILCEISTLDFNDIYDVNVQLIVMDLAGNVNECVFENVDIVNPDMEPPDVNFTAYWGGSEIDASTFVDGIIDVNVTPEDANERIKKIELWWGNKDCQDEQLITEAEDPNGFPIDVNSDNPWTYELNPYLFKNGPTCLVVHVWDMYGNETIESVEFFNNSSISDFRVTPSFVTALNPWVTVSASLKADANWAITIYDPCNHKVVDANQGTSNPVSRMFNANEDFKWNDDPVVDGDYIAHLDVGPGTHEANAPFVVALGSPEAEISNIEYEGDENKIIDELLRNPYNFEGLWQVIDQAFFDLEGAAYYPGSQANVQYKVELFRPKVSRYSVESWQYLLTDPNYFVKNITPNKGSGDWCENRVEPDGSLGTLDFTSVENGAYQMLLTVKYPDNNPSYGYANVGFVLDCPLKLGSVKFSQQDLDIAVGGVSLTVTRTYDSLNRNHDGDFGHGWTYSIANMDIELNEEREECDVLGGGATAEIRVSPNFARNVTLTLPDGERATFLLNLVPSSQPYTGSEAGYRTGLYFYKAVYVSPPGVTATLYTKEPELIHPLNGTWVKQGWGNSGEGVRNPANYDFSGYRLSTEDGAVYHIKRDKLSSEYGDYYWLGDQMIWTKPYGDPYLSHIITPGGEKISFNGDSIEHYNRKESSPSTTIQIDRSGGGGHIVAVRAPSEQDSGDPNTLEYWYDSNDNLIKVCRLVDEDATDYNDMYNITEYFYDNNDYDPCHHFVTDINDARGLTPIRYIYDQDGRLTEVIDARGNSITIDHDVQGRVETVEDRCNNVTTYLYNDRGNVIRITNPEGDTTAYEYDDPRHPDKATAITFPYPAGPTTYYQYDIDGRTKKTTDPLGNVTENYYDGSGNLLETAQLFTPDLDMPDDLVLVSSTTNTYNERYPGRSLLEKTTDALGNSTVYEYDDKNRMTRTIKKDPNGLLLNVDAIYTYDDNSDFPSSPNSVTNAAGFTTYSEYDENGNQIKSWYKWVDPNDSANKCTVATITEHDAAGRAIKTIRDVNYTEGNVQPYTLTLSQTSYNSIDKVDTVIGQYGALTKYQYDQSGNLVETLLYETWDDYNDHHPNYPADMNGILTISRTLYDPEGRTVIATGPYDPCDPNVNATENIYDSLGRVSGTWRWADVNIPLENIVVDGNTVGRKYIIDTNDDPVWSRGAVLSKTTTEYDGITGKVEQEKVQDEGGQYRTTRYEYDWAGKQTAVIDPLGNRTEYEYEGNRRDLVRDANGHETTFEHDALGRPKYTTYHDGTYTYTNYDQFGRVSSKTDQAGRIRWFDYDDAGRLKAVVLPAVADPCNNDELTYPRYEYDYDMYGNLTEIRDNIREDPETGNVDYTYERVTKFTYNEINKQITRKLPDGRTEYSLYDANGLPVKSTDFEAHVTGFEYNDRGQLQFQNFYDDNDLYQSNEPNIYYKLTYDNLGRVLTTEVNDLDTPGEPVIYKNYYDAEGRIWQLDLPDGFIRYEFFPITGRRMSVYTPESEQEAANFDTKLSYTYDELGRLKTVKVDKRNGQEPTSEISTYAYNDVGSIASVEHPNNLTTYRYDSLNRLTDVNIYDASQLVAHYKYALAPDGQRTGVTEVVDGSTTVVDWAYDALNRLIAEDYNAPDDANDFTHSYVYDLVGNRLERQVDNGPNTTYSYDPNNDRLITETTDTNTITYTYNENGSLTYKDAGEDPNVQYTYNFQRRLAKVQVEGGATVDYEYNPAGIRVEAAVQGGSTTQYLIDPYNHTGYAQVLKAAVNDDVNMVYVLGHDVLAQARGPNTPNYLLYDGHGSVRHLANTAGTITESYAYDAYGNAHTFSPANAATALLYAGEMYDNDLQHYYLRARYYSPATAKLLYMRTRKSAIMWRYYERAKSIIKAVSAGAIIASALFSLFTGAGYPQGDMKLSLPFGTAPHLEDWPDVDLVFKRSSGDKTLVFKVSFDTQPDRTSLPDLDRRDYWKDFRIGGTFSLNLDNPSASQFQFGASKTAPIVDAGPFQAGFGLSLSGPPSKLEAGFGVSFEPILKVMSFNVDFPLFTIDSSGIEMDWGTPVWKWGKDED